MIMSPPFDRGVGEWEDVCRARIKEDGRWNPAIFLVQNVDQAERISLGRRHFDENDDRERMHDSHLTYLHAEAASPKSFAGLFPKE